MPRRDIEGLIPPLLERPEMQDAEQRVDFLLGQFGMIHPADTTEEQAEYHNFIEGELRKSFESLTPEVLADPTKLRAITCVDKNAGEQLTGFYSGGIEADLLDPANRHPGGAFLLWKTGLLKEWVGPRMFNPYLLAPMHRGCGAIKVSVGPDQRVVQLVRQQVTIDIRKNIDEQAALIREVWRTTGSNLTEDEQLAIDSFHGPQIVDTPISSGGTAAKFIRGRIHETNPHSIYSLHDLMEKRDLWLASILSGDSPGVGGGFFQEASAVLGGLDRAATSNGNASGNAPRG